MLILAKVASGGFSSELTFKKITKVIFGGRNPPVGKNLIDPKDKNVKRLHLLSLLSPKEALANKQEILKCGQKVLLRLKGKTVTV